MKHALSILLLMAMAIFAQTPVVSTKNSSTTALAADSLFTGGWEDVSDFTGVHALVKPTPRSQGALLKFQWSTDSSASMSEDVVVAAPAEGKPFAFPVQGKYFRIVYVNGSTAQSAMKLQLFYSGKSGSATITGALPAGNNNIGDVDLASAIPTGANVIGGVTQSGTWTVQPGNTANTTAWKVDGSAVTQPVSGTVTANAGTGTFTVDSEFPAAAALSSGAANPTTTSVGSFNMLWNGSTWDRMSGNSSIGAKIFSDYLKPGLAATDLGKAEDAAHTTGDAGVLGLSVRNDSRGTLAGADLEYAPLQLNSSGDLRVDGSAVTQPVSVPADPFGLNADASNLNGSISAKLRYIANTGIPATSMPYGTRSDTYTTTSNGTTVDRSTSPLKVYSIQVKGTGAGATAWDVRLEGSNDGTNFTQIIQHTNTDLDGTVKFSAVYAFPCLYFRSRTSGLTLGGASNIVVTIVGTH